jgi:hypothetical protein
MTEYRAFFLNPKKHVERREDFDAADDEAALNHARQWADDAAVEVWSEGIFVGIVRTKTAPERPTPAVKDKRAF